MKVYKIKMTKNKIQWIIYKRKMMILIKIKTNNFKMINY